MKHQASSFQTLYAANHQRVRRLLARMAGAPEAEDLVQVVFARAAEALPDFRGDAQASTWLYRIAANVASDWLRSRAAHEARVTVPFSGPLDGETDEWFRDDQISPEQELIRKEMRACIRGVIAQLPDNDRTALLLGELGGLDDDDVARTLGISRGTAKVRLHRARARLRQALEARCNFYRDQNNEFACEPKPAACAASAPGRDRRATCGS